MLYLDCLLSGNETLVEQFEDCRGGGGGAVDNSRRQLRPSSEFKRPKRRLPLSDVPPKALNPSGVSGECQDKCRFI